jgi:hypothetical protein
MNSFCALYLASELECIIPLAGPGVVWLRGDQVAACHQFVAFDGGIIVDRPLITFENFGVA